MFKTYFSGHIKVWGAIIGVARGPRGPCPRQIFRTYNYFVLWDAVSHAK